MPKNKPINNINKHIKSVKKNLLIKDSMSNSCFSNVRLRRNARAEGETTSNTYYSSYYL